MTEVALEGALPKPWIELQNSRRQKQSLREEIDRLNSACQAEDGTKHLAECERCYPKSLGLIQSAYTQPALKTWFSDRSSLKNDLEARMQPVLAGEADLDVVETRLNQEKDAWYRELLLASPYLLDVGDNDIRREDLLASLADPDCHVDDIINPMWESISKPDKWSDQLETFIEKISAADGDEAVLRQLYAAELFRNRTTGETVAHAQPYLDALEGNNSTTAQPLDEVLENLIRDISAGKSSGSQRMILRKRLDELSRAKTAFEQNKVTQAKGRSAAGSREAAALTLLEPLPPCYTCEGEVNKTQVLSCSHCQMALQLAGEAGKDMKKLTLFCSGDCLQKGQPKHEDEAHECAAKDKCASLVTVSDDTDMDVDEKPLSPVACAPCIDEKELIIYCSSECADANIREHRHETHNVKTDPEDTTGTYKTIEEVAKMLEEANSGLKITWH